MKKFDDNKNIKTYKDSSIIKRLLKYMKPVLPYFIIALFFTAIVVVVDLLPAILEGYIIGLLNLDFANPSVKDKQLFEIASKFKEMNNLSDECLAAQPADCFMDEITVLPFRPWKCPVCMDEIVAGGEQ